MKICKKCFEEKPYEYFHKSKVSADRLYAWCKECSAKWRRVYNMKNASKQRKYFAEYRKDPLHKAAHASHVRARQANQREYYNKLSIEERQAIVEFYKERPSGFVVDHIYPVIRGGRHCLSNLQYLLVKDNDHKKAKIPTGIDITGSQISR